MINDKNSVKSNGASKIRIAINGFGRIGRQAFKIALTKPELQVVAINDLTEPDVLANLLKYDSVYGVYDKPVSFDTKKEKANPLISSAGTLTVDGRKTPIFAEKDPAMLPWRDLNVDVVLESTGRFITTELASAHLKAGAKKVIISAPAKDDGITPTFILGVNSDQYKGQNVISNASCTTNCITPVAAILHSKFGVKKMMMSTIHALTVEQNLVDGPPPPLHKDLRRMRAAGFNITPTSTGASIAATEVIPELKGEFGGIAFRVPVACGSLSDFTALLNKRTTVEEVNNAFIEMAKHPMWKNILEVTTDPIVSSDIIGNPHSAVVDLSLTQVVDGDMVKVVAWYDNEFGYANRFVEQAILIGKE
ncbi:MAG: type I glyceraldehyde-3-phosphate dehydrogenase [Candidatus Doudnabacteria bacterium RIFCSPLOWO2_02_FULL_49_13]|uniref:Glyceraldehyde-3-phosphate dehydrogenase n=1 Tax=Candidatus Doudnabacteria bacterium RIFCSPHIGHO2_12_FULL_48_16 TaxID=1817838 RepID=A0A1F5PJ57_9BACT|nr:MAG: type I glyceraldehyde-3-phosphate dehydrogenase [Candidatus Doudnabacteria bacterium RIFCSPHIGHO2_02_FULL_49_24]OGE89334.1 MAG: type I glyceraldehyde-3-phosphate dehydrogenase [Candidatus Doudnabacteria bacterium RIFCSPHIGHO2_01_FULL_50_67]OGE89975.1 MAG: type I glyceraldehyde-3-phosphate dehydrogenase [Candidatus Doudnabacteria bacterium RIFCSPHIGHO2_12_FULL_48_16]OGE97480.1 MAG: type I glyceraldehyde-3-phosphate dehydrogenase [Candidatus Doudnabacteria bacterium RIFCSPLOWO2_01_FULL_49_